MFCCFAARCKAPFYLNNLWFGPWYLQKLRTFSPFTSSSQDAIKVTPEQGEEGEQFGDGANPFTNVLGKITEQQNGQANQEGQFRENRWESESPCYWCWKVGHLARWHKLDWSDSTSFTWSTNRKAWHVVQAMHRADKSPKAIMETLEVKVNLKAHPKGRDRLIAIAKAHAEQLRAGKQAPEGEAEKIRKKKKKNKKAHTDAPAGLPAGDDEMIDTSGPKKPTFPENIKVKIEPQEDNDKKPAKGFHFSSASSGTSLQELQLSSEMGAIRLNVKGLDSRLTSTENSLKVLSTDVKSMKESIQEVRYDNAENKTVMHMLLKGQGWSREEIDKRMASAKEKAKAPLATEPIPPQEPSSENIAGSNPRSEASASSKRSLHDMELTEVQVPQPLDKWSKDELTNTAVKHGVNIDVFATFTKAMIICALSHTLREGLWAIIPDIGANQGKFCAVPVRVCEVTKSGVLRWGTDMPARPDPWMEKGEKINVDVPLDLCLSNIFLQKDDALDRAKVPAAKRGRRSTSPLM